MPAKKSSAGRSRKPSSSPSGRTPQRTSSAKKATSSEARTSTSSSPRSTVEVAIGEEFSESSETPSTTTTASGAAEHLRRPVWEPGETRQQFQKRLEEYKQELGEEARPPRRRERSTSRAAAKPAKRRS